MSESHSLQQAWILLKDYTLLNHLPDEYYDNLSQRMMDRVKSRKPLEHVNADPHEHYKKRLSQRYNENQELPNVFKKRGMKGYKFNLADIFSFMANDLANNHPEIIEAMKLKKPASDERLDEREPSLSFDVMRTDDPKLDESEKQMGLSHTVTPHFNLDENDKLQLKTIGHGMLNDKTRQNIHVLPTTSPIPPEQDTHNNSRIHEGLPNRVDFFPRDVPSTFEDLQTPPPAPEPFDKYANLPPAFRDAARRADKARDIQTGEPMNMAWRLLKGLV